MNDTDQELIAEFMRLRKTDSDWVFEVADLDWVNDPIPPPVKVWKRYRHWRQPPSAARLAAAQARALTDRRYFRRCRCCWERNPVGHLGDDATCHACAERFFGVVF